MITTSIISIYCILQKTLINSGRSSNKKKRYWKHLFYMDKSKSGRSLPGVEHKPKNFKRPIQEQENDIVIWVESRWYDTSMKSKFNKFSKFFFFFSRILFYFNYRNFFILYIIWVIRELRKSNLFWKIEKEILDYSS